MLAACWVLAAYPVEAQSNWRGIQPGTSTRAQVERITGAPVQALTDTLAEYKGTQPDERVFVQYRAGGVVDRVEILMAAPVERAAAQREFGLAAVPEVSKKNSRGKTEEYYGSAMVVLTLGDAGVERRAYYSRELFEASGGKTGGTTAITGDTNTGGGGNRGSGGIVRAPIWEEGPSNNPGPRTLTIPAATRLDVRLMDKLSTDRNKAGDQFRATLDQPLHVDGVVVAARGADVEGKITSLTKSGRTKGLGEMHLELTSLRLANGQSVAISTGAFVQIAESSVGGDAKKTAAAAAIGAAIGAMAGGGKGAAIGAGAGGGAMGGAVLLTRGKPAELAVEALLSFQITSPVAINLPANVTTK